MLKISIITVVKNGMPYLKTSIKSFQLQNFSNKEHIIVCSKSSDDTELYLKSIKDINTKIIIDDVSKNRYGAINKGIESSTGDVIGLLHSDDIFYNDDTLEIINKNFINDVNCVYGDILFCEKKNINFINRIWISSKFEKKKLSYGWTPPHTSLFIKKNLLIDNLYNEDFEISGDYYFILKLFSSNNIKPKYVNEYFSIMRQGGDSTKINKFILKFKEDLKIANFFFKKHYLCIFLKIFSKIFQINIFTKKVKSTYLDKINLS